MIGKKYFRNQTPLTGPAAADDGEAVRVVKVLIVDDVPDILDYFLGVFRRVRGVDVKLTVEADSSAALERVKREAFGVVITDFRMKGVNGIQILQAARAFNPDGLRVLMTGYNEIPASVDEIRQAEVDAYLQKPLAAQELLLLVHDLLNENEVALTDMRERAREIEFCAAGEERERLSGPLG